MPQTVSYLVKSTAFKVSNQRRKTSEIKLITWILYEGGKKKQMLLSLHIYLPFCIARLLFKATQHRYHGQTELSKTRYDEALLTKL